MMKTPEDVLTDEDLRYLKIAISLALTGVDIEEMAKTKEALGGLPVFGKTTTGNPRRD
jgi:hypothetical protein